MRLCGGKLFLSYPQPCLSQFAHGHALFALHRNKRNLNIVFCSCTHKLDPPLSGERLACLREPHTPETSFAAPGSSVKMPHLNRATLCVQHSDVVMAHFFRLLPMKKPARHNALTTPLLCRQAIQGRTGFPNTTTCTEKTLFVTFSVINIHAFRAVSSSLAFPTSKATDAVACQLDAVVSPHSKEFLTVSYVHAKRACCWVLPGNCSSVAARKRAERRAGRGGAALSHAKEGSDF